MEQDYDLHAAFKPEKIVMTIAGFYPTRHLKRRILYVLNAFVITSISLIQFVSMLIFIYCNISDLTNISEGFLYCMSVISFLCKLLNIVLQNKNVRKLEDMLQNPIFTKVSVEEECILKPFIKNVRFLVNVFKLMCFLAACSLIVFPLNSEEEKFPILSWYPFNPSNYYYEVYIFQSISIIICAGLTSHVDILMIIAIVLGTAQFEILKRRLTNITNQTEKIGTKKEEKLVQERLRRYIIHYDSILGFVSLIENTYAGGIFVQLLGDVLVIALTGFQLVVVESLTLMQFAFYISYVLCMIIQVAIYSWYGQRLMDSNDQVTQACYMAEWNECNMPIQKSLIIIMERAKVPTLIRAMHIVPLNLQTFVIIIRSSYSYFAVLQTLYNANNNRK